MSQTPEFTVGQVVLHKRFHYRGVIFDIDPIFMLSDEWYEQVALSRPPKDQAWYHVLVDTSANTTYVAERHLQRDESKQQINHPLLGNFFKEFINGVYIPKGIH